MYRLLLFLSLGFLLLSAGCTNVAGDHARVITAPEGKALSTNVLLAVAMDFFSAAGYGCGEDSRQALYCRKDLRDFYIHQTHAVVEIFAGDDAGSHLLVSTRWDEGLIPSELISSKYQNPDIKKFCTTLDQEKVGHCVPVRN